MNLASRRQILPTLATLVCLNANATEPARKPAFLRTAPQVQITEEAESPSASPEVENTARKILGITDFFDPRNPDIKHFQRYEDAMGNLPLDKNGFPDWMRALRESKIHPRAGISPNAAMNILDLDVVMKNTKEMPYVRFPHYSHTLWLDCSNCHPVPFEPRAGSTSILMADIFRGKYCGMCHDRVAFITFFSCQRCHSVPQPGGTTLPH